VPILRSAAILFRVTYDGADDSGDFIGFALQTLQFFPGGLIGGL
jgi:hypothetical protein